MSGFEEASNSIKLKRFFPDQAVDLHAVGDLGDVVHATTGSVWRWNLGEIITCTQRTVMRIVHGLGQGRIRGDDVGSV